jgi:hypothetical protein
MKTSAEAKAVYKKINAIWENNNFPIRFSQNEVNEKVDFDIAKRVVRTFWKREMGRKIPYKIREGSGNRDNWVSWRTNVLTLNTQSGWSNIVHDIGHLIHLKKHSSERPHSPNHAVLELRFVKFVFENDYITKSKLAMSEKKVKTRVTNVVAKNYKKLKSRKDNLLKKQKQYESNLKRVANSLKKVERSIAQYEKKYDEDRLTAKFSEPVERKVGKHPKQKLAELCEQHDWLRAERDDEWEGELRIDVYDKRVAENDEDYFAPGSSGEYCCWSWKEAYERALELIENNQECST